MMCLLKEILIACIIVRAIISSKILRRFSIWNEVTWSQRSWKRTIQADESKFEDGTAGNFFAYVVEDRKATTLIWHSVDWEALCERCRDYNWSCFCTCTSIGFRQRRKDRVKNHFLLPERDRTHTLLCHKQCVLIVQGRLTQDGMQWLSTFNQSPTPFDGLIDLDWFDLFGNTRAQVSAGGLAGEVRNMKLLLDCMLLWWSNEDDLVNYVDSPPHGEQAYFVQVSTLRME